MKFSEYNDIFGFGKKILPKSPSQLDDLPINTFDVEYLSQLLSQSKINNKIPQVQFINRIYWGEEAGALRTKITIKLGVLLEKLNYDLEGTRVWGTKKAFQINREGFGGNEEQVAEEILKELTKIDEQQIDSPKKDYDELEKLVQSITQKVRRTAADIFVYQGIKKVDEDTYIIRFNVRGHGLSDQDQMRVEENQTWVVFYRDRGVIRVMNYNIESKTGGSHSWSLMPVDLDLYFFPTQSKEEIAETVAITFRWY